MVAAAVCIPDWPFYNHNQPQWLPTEGKASVTESADATQNPVGKQRTRR